MVRNAALFHLTFPSVTLYTQRLQVVWVVTAPQSMGVHMVHLEGSRQHPVTLGTLPLL